MKINDNVYGKCQELIIPSPWWTTETCDHSPFKLKPAKCLALTSRIWSQLQNHTASGSGRLHGMNLSLKGSVAERGAFLMHTFWYRIQPRRPQLAFVEKTLETNVWASFGVKTWGRRQISSNLVASIGRFWSLENPQGCTIFYEPICCPYMSGELHAPRFSQKLHRNFQTLGQLSFLVKSNPLTMWVRPLLPRY